ncbi:adenine deaminase C-terminal domain-containing protein, partial [Oenococcus oeni]|uniref:adenine deaminase C-terminal domain-containing protein n=1 Tax=Oenococcus oeni TaxID=1247 RepID=UPI000B2BEA59
VAQHVKNVGALTDGFIADLVIISNLDNFVTEKVMTEGNWVDKLESKVTTFTSPAVNAELSLNDLKLPLKSDKAHVINIQPEHITTKHTIESVNRDQQGNFVADQDYAKIIVAERYHNLGHGLGIIHGFNMQEGAIGSTIAHDSVLTTNRQSTSKKKVRSTIMFVWQFPKEFLQKELLQWPVIM